MSYNFNAIEAKWQAYWKRNHSFQAENPGAEGVPDAPPYYVLDMFPYPSGAGLHVGHPLGYIASDIVSRYQRHKGYNVLHPMGYDSFGLPAEQYAIQTGQHPAITTRSNIKRYREQLDKLGFSFDWSREVRTSDPNYYKWTQWIFIQLFDSWYDKTLDKARPIRELIAIFKEEGNIEINAACGEVEVFSAEEWREFSANMQQEYLLQYRLTYLAETEVNWCPKLGTVLANDEIVNGVSERGGYPVERKKMKQWNMRITAYAERLLQGLETLDWTDSLKESQRNWIGKSEGAQIDFRILYPRDKKKKTEDVVDPIVEANEKKPADSDNAYLYDAAREFRENPTEAEEKLWSHLKDKNMGYLFKRQQVLGDFIINFICPNRKLIVEIDREEYKKSQEYIEKRDKILENKGYTVLHIQQEDILENKDPVLKRIKKNLNYAILKDKVIQAFTTRPDTLFGVTFMTLAPEHDLIEKITSPQQKKAVKKYIKETAKHTERERMAHKTISGVFTGAYAEHPITGEPIPIWISDYVLASYGTGAVMAVPAGDERDYKFAQYFDIPVQNIFKDFDPEDLPYSGKTYSGLTHSEFLNGLPYKEAMNSINRKLENSGYGENKINYRLRDAVFSRQRYWGEPFPVYYKENIPYTIPEHCLPLKLPEVEKYLPTKEGNPPLGQATCWHWDEDKEKVTAVKKGEKSPIGVYRLELNTMPGWAGSSWYFFRYMEKTARDEVFASKEALDYWQKVDLYIGGSEHATGHLLYARFWTKFLKDRGMVSVEEPFKKLINQGMILGESAFVYRVDGKNTLISAGQLEGEKVHPIHTDVNLVNISNELDIEGFKKWRPEFKEAKFVTEENDTFKVRREVEKMSKSKYNVVNPDDICQDYGADSLRLYEMFLGPLDQAKPWNTAGLSGVHGFLKKLWRLYHSAGGPGEQHFYVSEEPASENALKILHQTIEKVTEDIENFNFNTGVSSLMICVNELAKEHCQNREILEPLAILISPYAPHIAEELWEKLGYKESISTAQYPVYKEKYVKESTKTYPIAFNGKKRFTIDLSLNLPEDEIEQIVMSHERTRKQLNGRVPKKVIVIPGKIVNIVG